MVWGCQGIEPQATDRKEPAMTITAISSSIELAAILNAPPATESDAAETPLDWTDGIWLAGTVYPLDVEATTATRAVLADGTAAVEWSPKGTWCTGQHRVGTDYERAHWCDADVSDWAADGDARGVRRDWRSVYVWDANGFSETTVYDTLDLAREAFHREVAELEQIGDRLAAEDPYRDDADDDDRY